MDTVKCPTCKHIWQEDLVAKALQRQETMRGDEETVPVRVTCPKCSTGQVIDFPINRLPGDES